jgi:hypothetical protein
VRGLVQTKPVQSQTANLGLGPVRPNGWTVLSPTPDRVRPDWWNHWLERLLPLEMSLITITLHNTILTLDRGIHTRAVHGLDGLYGGYEHISACQTVRNGTNLFNYSARVIA